MTSRHERPPGRPPQAAGANSSDARLRRILVDGDAEELVNFAEELGRQLVDRRLKTVQIRKFFAEVRRLGDEARVSRRPADLDRIYRRLTLLRPKLAYQARRAEGVGDLRAVLDPAILLVTQDRSDPQRLTRFVEFFEAILAYHKFHGGQD
jgi:CRISPR-associated protein Csm2